MFGPVMEFDAPQHRIRMAPIRRDEMVQFVTRGGMQLHSVTRYLGMQLAPTAEDEFEWYDRVRTDTSSRSWGIYVYHNEQWLLIGNTALHDLSGKNFPRAISGCQIFRAEFWGKGIAGACHRARTMYAFDQLCLAVVRSAVMTANDASFRALQGVGYVQVSQERNEAFRDGNWLHKRNMEMVNPSSRAWCSWWHGEVVPVDFRRARPKTEAALDWARRNVVLL